MRPRLRGNPQSRLAHVALDDFDALGDKLREPLAKPLLQRVEYGRLLENFLKAPLRGRRALAADQQVDLADLRDFVQKLRQPHLADKARDPDQKNVFPRQGVPHRERFGLFFPVEYDQGAMIRRLGALRRQNCLFQPLRMLCQPEISQQAVRRHAAVGAALEGPGDWAPRPNHRIEQAAGGDPIAEFEPVRNEAGNAQILRQGPHHMVESLADQHHILRALFRHAGPQALDALRLQLLFQDVFEIFLAQRIQAVARNPGQERMQDTRGKHPVARVEEGPHQRQRQRSSAAGPAPRERVGIPGEVGHGADGAERNQAPFHAPERQGMKVRLQEETEECSRERGGRWNYFGRSDYSTVSSTPVM